VDLLALPRYAAQRAECTVTDSKVQLRRVLGLGALVAYGVGDILGAGIYALVGKVAGAAGTLAWLSFGCTLLVAGLTALSYAELGSRFPRSGGEARFSERAFGRPWLALFIGWLVFASGVVSVATVSRAFSGYVVELLRQSGAAGGPSLNPMLIAAFLLTLGGIVFWGIRQASVANIVCTLVEAAGLILVIVVGAVYLLGNTPAAPAPAEAPLAVRGLGVAQGAALAFFAFIGFEDMVNVSEEVREPGRNLPIAILTALLVAGSIYMLLTWLATQIVSPEVLSAADGPLLMVMQQAAPWFPLWVFTVITALAVSNTGLLNMVMVSRLMYGMAEQQLLPPWLARLHPRTRTPHRAIATILLVIVALAISGTLKGLAGTTSTLLLAVFFTMNVALIVLKRREQESSGGFRIPLFVPILGALSTVALMPFAPRPSLLLAGAIFGIGGVLIFVQRRFVAKG